MGIGDRVATRSRDRGSLSPDSTSVGIVSVGMYLPEPVLTATDIAEASGLPEWVVREKLGINEKRMAGPAEQDGIINIIEGVKQGRLKEGDLMIIVGAGVGYVWGAACVKWGPCETDA